MAFWDFEQRLSRRAKLAIWCIYMTGSQHLGTPNQLSQSSCDSIEFESPLQLLVLLLYFSITIFNYGLGLYNTPSTMNIFRKAYNRLKGVLRKRSPTTSSAGSNIQHSSNPPQDLWTCCCGMTNVVNHSPDKCPTCGHVRCTQCT